MPCNGLASSWRNQVKGKKLIGNTKNEKKNESAIWSGKIHTLLSKKFCSHSTEKVWLETAKGEWLPNETFVFLQRTSESRSASHSIVTYLNFIYSYSAYY